MEKGSARGFLAKWRVKSEKMASGSVAFFVVRMEYEHWALNSERFYDGHFFVGAAQCLRHIGVRECFYL